MEIVIKVTVDIPGVTSSPVISVVSGEIPLRESKKDKEFMKKCSTPGCLADFTTDRAYQRFCSKKCRLKYNAVKKRDQRRSAAFMVPSPTISQDPFYQEQLRKSAAKDTAAYGKYLRIS